MAPDADVRLHDLDSAANLDPVRLAVFREYLQQECAGPFIDGMGSYEILQMVREYICPGRRLDVGSGTAALFWILAKALLVAACQALRIQLLGGAGIHKSRHWLMIRDPIPALRSGRRSTA